MPTAIDELTPGKRAESEEKRHSILIAAAVSAVLGRHVRISHIAPAQDVQPSKWIRQGRTSVQSHNLNRSKAPRIRETGGSS